MQCAPGKRTPADEEARLVRIELQQAPDTPVGPQRAHRVLGALQRGHADQELVRRHFREIVVEVARSGQRIHVALLDLQRQCPLKMSEQRVGEGAAHLELEALGELGRGGHGRKRQYLDPVLVAAGADLIGDIADLEGMGVHATLGDEGTHAGHAHQHPVLGELLQGPVGGHARNGQLAHQLVLGGHSLAGLERPPAMRSST